MKRIVFVLCLASLAQEPGRRLYDAQCALCHGIGGNGGRGPALNTGRLQRAADQQSLEQVIAGGIDGTEMPESWQLSPREVTLVAQYVLSLSRAKEERIPGDARRGRDVYLRQRCTACHITNGEGEAWGPELSTIGLRRSAAYLKESIVRPEAAVPRGFRFIEAQMPAGPRRGIRLAEDSFAIQIVDEQRRLLTLRRSSASWRPSDLRTPMPRMNIPEPDLTDLIAYLVSLRGKP